MEKKKPFVLDVNGTQVFSADFVFEQMQAQSRRIDRAEAKAAIAAIIAIVSLIFNIVLLRS
jgi:hypothetical protein